MMNISDRDDDKVSKMIIEYQQANHESKDRNGQNMPRVTSYFNNEKVR